MNQFDYFVIGGGSAGLKAAKTARSLGATVGLAEEVRLGGECFWAGCVPTKAMVRAAQVWSLVGRAREFGIEPGSVRGDFAAAMAYKDRKVREVGGDSPDEEALARYGIAWYPGRAVFDDSHTLRIGDATVSVGKILIATGTVPAVPPIPGLAEIGYITNREAVSLSSLPASLLILGGGPIGLEFAQVFRRFGAKVTVIELAPRILPIEDAEISELAAGFLRSEGITIRTSARAACAEREGKRKRLHVDSNGQPESFIADEILVATGRNAAVRGLGLEAAGVEHTPHAIRADSYLRTNQPHISVAGDCAGGYLFTHVASFEGRLAAWNAFGAEPVEYNPRVVPRATFIDPEIASIGVTEETARSEQMDIEVRTARFADLDRAILHGDSRGIVKIISRRGSGEIVGAHLAGPEASTLLPEIALAMQHGLPVQAVASTMHAYPTFPEAVEAAALSSPRC